MLVIVLQVNDCVHITDNLVLVTEDSLHGEEHLEQDAMKPPLWCGSARPPGATWFR